MAQVREGHEPSVRDPVREQPSVARVDHVSAAPCSTSVRAPMRACLMRPAYSLPRQPGPTGLADPLDGSRPLYIVSIC